MIVLELIVLFSAYALTIFAIDYAWFVLIAWPRLPREYRLHRLRRALQFSRWRPLLSLGVNLVYWLRRIPELPAAIRRSRKELRFIRAVNDPVERERRALEAIEIINESAAVNERWQPWLWTAIHERYAPRRRGSAVIARACLKAAGIPSEIITLIGPHGITRDVCVTEARDLLVVDNVVHILSPDRWVHGVFTHLCGRYQEMWPDYHVDKDRIAADGALAPV